MRALRTTVLLFVIAGCGNAAPEAEPEASNAIPIAVNGGPPNIDYVNGLFTTVTVCVPGTTDCQSIDSVLVDTGSMGLRILSASAGGELSTTLPLETGANGEPIVECNAFIDSYTWGPLRLADITMGGEKARSVPVQVVGDPSFSSVPSSCSAIGGSNDDTLELLGAYAILGVGPFPQDCGEGCAESPTAANTNNPGNVYYSCPSTGCQPAAVDVQAQIQNPVSALPVDNNGMLIDLSSVPAGGASGATGSLLFGIGTESNNGLNGATVLPIDPETLTFTTAFMGKDYSMSFIDSGSNGTYFLDSSLTGIPLCTNALYNDDYCPDAPMSLTATNLGTNGTSSVVNFTVANAGTLFGNETNYAFDDLAGPSGSSEYFDWGLSFFFGRKVFSAIEGASAPGGSTPYFAY